LKHSHINFESELRVGILGIAFKGVPATNDLRGSLGVTLIRELKTRFPSLYMSAFDPVVTKEDLGDLDLDLAEKSSLVFKDANLVIITNNHPDFSSLNLGELSNAMSGSALIYDLWGRYKTAMLENGNLVTAWGAHGLAQRLIR
jgi:UDP-N-acetyl-D-mannosaminuronic acid dehydrogenase